MVLLMIFVESKCMSLIITVLYIFWSVITSRWENNQVETIDGENSLHTAASQ